MLLSFEELEFVIGDPQGFEIGFGKQSEMIEMMLDFQTIQFEHGIQIRKDKVVLRRNPPDGRLCALRFEVINRMNRHYSKA